MNITFDYDSIRALMRRAPLDIVAQSRGKFTPNVAIPRILDLLDRRARLHEPLIAIH